MMKRNRKEGGRVCIVLLHVIRKSLTLSENRLTAILTYKKTKSNPRFKPGLLRQNAIALPLVPPPLVFNLTFTIVLSMVHQSPSRVTFIKTHYGHTRASFKHFGVHLNSYHLIPEDKENMWSRLESNPGHLVPHAAA